MGSKSQRSRLSGDSAVTVAGGALCCVALLAGVWLADAGAGGSRQSVAAEALSVTVGVLGVGYYLIRRSEANRRESESQFHTLADNIPQLAWMARPDGHIYWYNRRWYEYTGTTLATQEGWRWESVHDPDELPKVLAGWQASIATGEPFDMVFPLRGADGSFRPFLTRVMPVKDTANRVTHWFGTNTDISEQQDRAEELRSLAGELSEADRRKDEFLATLAHELRNPLAPIRNGLHILRESEGATKAGRTLAMMDRQLSHMVRLVDDLLDASRISRGKIALSTGRLELRAMIEAAAEDARPLVEKAGHELAVALPDAPIYVEGDATRLAQVVTNLLSNSAKYTHAGGRVRLALGRESGHAVVSVRDDGIGIPPAMLGRVFEMFTQVDRELEKTTGGLGIGLSLVKGLVEMHGGTVEARSEGEGRGSEFVVRLPVAASGSPRAEFSARPSS